MKSLLILPLLFLSPLLMGQVHPAPLEYKFSLSIGDELQLGDKALRFKSVISDSRCPESVNCIWEGRAELLFELFDNGKKLGETSFSTSSNLHGDQLAQVFSGEPFYLSDLILAPYPERPGTIALGDYQVQLLVKIFPEESGWIRQLQHS